VASEKPAENLSPVDNRVIFATGLWGHMSCPTRVESDSMTLPVATLDFDLWSASDY